MKIRIFQPIVPEYRVALFNGVGERYRGKVEVWASDSLNKVDCSCPLTSCVYDYAHKWHKFGPFVWQSGFRVDDLSPQEDVVVINGDIHQISTLRIAILCKIKGIKVVWWGHHKTSTSKPLGVKIRLAIAKLLSDVFLCYTKTGILYLEERGFLRGRVFATGNTIDQTPIASAIERFRLGIGCDKLIEYYRNRPFVLCCGVMREKVHLDLFISAMADPRLENICLVVIGDGPMKETWQKMATELGVDGRVKWMHGTRNQEDMAPWFLNAKAFLYPGSIGLSILHSFSYGLPVVTHGNANHHMPEFDVMEDGKTGVCFVENDIEDLICKTAAFLKDEPRRVEMGRYCQKLAFEKYSMDQMVDNFCEAIEA